MHQIFLQLAIGERLSADHAVQLKVSYCSHLFFFLFAADLLTVQFVSFSVSHGYKVLSQFGVPSFRPFSALKEWGSRALPSTDFQYASMSLIFLSRIPTRLVFVPSTVLATYHVVIYIAAHYRQTLLWEKYGKKLHKTMVDKQVRDEDAMVNITFHC